MARRTISLNDGFENAVRKYQTVMMLECKRDVTFTEALNNVLLRAFVGGGAWGKGEPNRQLTQVDFAEILEGGRDMNLEGALDLLPANVADVARKALPG